MFNQNAKLNSSGGGLITALTGGVVYGVNDLLNEAISELSSKGGGFIDIRPGEYSLTSALIMQPNVYLRAYPNTKFFMENVAHNSPELADGTLYNMVVFNSGLVDGGELYNCGVMGGIWDFQRSIQSSQAAVAADSASDYQGNCFRLVGNVRDFYIGRFMGDRIVAKSAIYHGIIGVENCRSGVAEYFDAIDCGYRAAHFHGKELKDTVKEVRGITVQHCRSIKNGQSIYGPSAGLNGGTNTGFYAIFNNAHENKFLFNEAYGEPGCGFEFNGAPSAGDSQASRNIITGNIARRCGINFSIGMGLKDTQVVNNQSIEALTSGNTVGISISTAAKGSGFNILAAGSEPITGLDLSHNTIVDCMGAAIRCATSGAVGKAAVFGGRINNNQIRGNNTALIEGGQQVQLYGVKAMDFCGNHIDAGAVNAVPVFIDSTSDDLLIQSNRAIRQGLYGNNCYDIRAKNSRIYDNKGTIIAGNVDATSVVRS